MNSIILPTWAIQGILDGRIKNYRVPLKPQPPEGTELIGRLLEDIENGTYDDWVAIFAKSELDMEQTGIKLPFQPGKPLYVRETWAIAYNGEEYFYEADRLTRREDKRYFDYNDAMWRSPVTMPREAARYEIVPKRVKAQKMQNITVDDLFAEGYICKKDFRIFQTREEIFKYGLSKFKSDNDYKYRKTPELQWDANPWTVVGEDLEVRKIEKTL